MKKSLYLTVLLILMFLDGLIRKPKDDDDADRWFL